MEDFARWEDLEDLKVLWDTCFGDPPAYRDFYFCRRFAPGETLVWREGGRPVSMMTLMKVRSGGEEGAYIYAVATLPEYRGRGLMTRLDAWSKEVIRRRGGRFSVLVPANSGLFAMYEKLGYQARFSIWTREVDGTDRDPGNFSPCSFEEFRALRESFLQKISGAAVHPEQELRYVYDELKGFSGEIFRYEEKGQPCYVAFSREEKALFIREVTGSDPVGTARALLCRFGMERARIRYHRPAEGFQRVLYGMGRRLDGAPYPEGYMALMLD